MSKFLTWWYREGSGINPKHFHDIESFARQICAIAWSNGEYVAFAERDRLYSENAKLKEEIEFLRECRMEAGNERNK